MDTMKTWGKGKFQQLSPLKKPRVAPSPEKQARDPEKGGGGGGGAHHGGGGSGDEVGDSKAMFDSVGIAGGDEHERAMHRAFDEGPLSGAMSRKESKKAMKERKKTFNKMKSNRDVLIERVHDKVGVAPPTETALEYEFAEYLAKTEWNSDESDVDENDELERMMRGMALVDEAKLEKDKEELAKAYVDEYAYENLDTDDFLLTTFVPPDKFKAMGKAMDDVLWGGKRALSNAGAKELGVLGPGMSLYFLMLEYLVYFSAVGTIMALPSLMATAQGTRVPDEKMDPFFMSMLTLGNLGGSTETVSNATDCALTNCNATYVDYFGLGTTKDEETSLIITAGDFVYSLWFLIMLLIYRRKITTVADEIDRNNVTAADFSVYVEGLPRDASEDEVMEHFSDLYQLDSPDWEFGGYCCGTYKYKVPRKPGHIRDRGHVEDGIDGKQHVRFKHPNFKPVENVDMHRKESYKRSWVADVAISRPNGKAITLFQQRKAALAVFRAARAKVKKYDTRSKFHDHNLKLKALKELAKVEKAYKSITKKTVKVDDETCVSAFVTFNHEESLLHCLADYKGSFGFCSRWFQPPPLRFRMGEFRLSVREAPEPSNVLWENLEIGDCNRAVRVAFTTSATVFMLLLSFVAFFQAQVTQTTFADSLPSPAFCDVQLPAMDHFPTTPESPRLARNATGDHFLCWRETETWIFYPTGDFFAFNRTGQSCLHPCVSYDDPTVCTSTLSTLTFTANDIRNCFCQAELTRSIAEGGVAAGPERVISENGDICSTFVEQYIAAQAVSVLMPLLVTAVNLILNVTLRWLALTERHHTLSAQSKAIAEKTFYALFLNTGILALIVNANIPGDTGKSMQVMGMFSGPYSGFTADWYTNVGQGIAMSMVINIVAPHGGMLANVLVIGPLKRKLLVPQVTTQRDMNDLYVEANFEISETLPNILNSLAVCMFYCSGMPLLMPIQFVTFLFAYLFEKWLVLRKAPKPPNYDTTLAKFASNVMVVALIMHCAIAVWMYGEPDLTKSEEIELDQYRIPGVFETKSAYSSIVRPFKDNGRGVGAEPRMTRQNTFPMVMLLLLAVVVLSWNLFAGAILKALFKRALTVLSCGLWAPDPNTLAGLIYKNKEWNPPYAEEFKMQLDPTKQQTLPAADVLDGWEIDRTDGQQLKVRRWKDSGDIDGVPHLNGTLMRTWEVMQAKNLHLYDIMLNDEYRFALVAMAAAQREQVKAKKREKRMGALADDKAAAF